MRLRPLVGILALMLSIVPAAGAASPVAADGCADVNVRLRNFKLEAKWVRPTVSVGDTAVMKVLATRTSEEDPVTDDGQPYPTGRPMDEPAEGVTVGLSMMVGDVYLNAPGGVTNADGEANVKIKIKSYAKPGVGQSRLYAELIHTPPDFPSPTCRLVVFEWGSLDPAPKLKVVR